MIYEPKHVRAAAGIDPPTLRNWQVRGLVEPTIPSGGRGNPAKFTSADLMTVVALARLCDMGLAPADAVGLAEAVGGDAADYLMRKHNAARPSVEEMPWRLYWQRTEEGWSWATEPDPENPTITLDAAKMAEAAMRRLFNYYPEMEK